MAYTDCGVGLLCLNRNERTGDVHPLPGPDSTSNRIAVRTTSHRHTQRKSTIRGRDPSDWITLRSNHPENQQLRDSCHTIPVQICNGPCIMQKNQFRV